MLGTLLLTLAAGGTGGEPTAALVLLPDAVVALDGTLQRGVAVTIEDGRITAVGPAPAEGAVRVHGVLAPGMVDAYSAWGADGFVFEESRQLTPGLRAADGVDPESEAFAGLLARGVTAVHLVPEPSNVLAGRGVLLATGGALQMLAAQTAQTGSLRASAIYDQRVGPTSLAGGLELLEAALAESAQDVAGDGLWLAVQESEGVRGARALCERAGLAMPLLVCHGDLGGYGGDLAGALVVVPADPQPSARAAEVWKRLAASGTRFAVGSRGGNPELNGLRTAAMALSRATGDAGAAWAAVTAHPAEALGMAGEMGVIAPGARADLVLWSAHPLDAAARVEAVMIGGETVWRPSAAEEAR